MSPCLLLVHDSDADVAVVAEVAASLGLVLVHARPAAESLKLFGTKRPAWVLLCPSAEGGRGAMLLSELKRHPYGGRARFLLLGEGVAGRRGDDVEPLPLEAGRLAARLRNVLSDVRSHSQREAIAAAARDAALRLQGSPGVMAQNEPGEGGELTATRPPTSPVVAQPDAGASPPSAGGVHVPPRPFEVGRLTARVREALVSEGAPAPEHPVAAASPVAAVVALPPRLEPGAGEEPLEPFARRLASWAADPRLQRIHLEDDAGRGRWLWLDQGRVVAASSSVAAESLLERARLDGLVTAGELATLRDLRRASPAEQLAAMRGRGWVREDEAAPLVSRHLRAVALEALAAARIRFDRTPADALPDDTPSVPPGVPALALLVESLRRSTQPAAVLERIGGVAARVVPLPHLLPQGALELTARERAWWEGWEASGGTVEALLLGSGLREDAALTLLAALEVLGALEFQPPEQRAPAALGVRELERLAAKLQEVSRADYFEVLGLQRTAGTGEVLRAWETLRAEFEPLKYVGHPDAGLVRDAQAVCAALDEAMRALRDDRLRAAYARYLVG